MNDFTPIELDRLPPPEVVRAPDYTALLTEMKAAVIVLVPELEEPLSLESDPATKLLRVCAYFRALDRAEFNDGARASMLAFATGSDLDNLAAFWGVSRLTVTPGDAEARPPVLAIMESDYALRRRTQLSVERLATSGTRGKYEFEALSASGDIEDVAILSHHPGPGDVTAVLLSHSGDGTPTAETIAIVRAAITHEDVRTLNDTIYVEGAEIIPYAIEAELTLFEGPDEAIVLATARDRVIEHVERNRRLGHDVTRAGLTAALFVDGAVQNIRLIAPAADVIVGARQAAHASTAPVIRIGGRDV